MAEIDAIIDQIIVLQKAVPLPAGERDIQDATDEPPANLSAFPMFVNVEERTPATGGAACRRVPVTVSSWLARTVNPSRLRRPQGRGI